MSFLIFALGLASALAAAFAASRIAGSADHRPAAAYGLCGFFVAILVYGGALQTQILYVHPTGAIAMALGPEGIFLAFAGLSALAAVAAGAGLMAAWTALIRRGEQPAGRFKTTGIALLFSFAITILAAPFLIQNQLTIESSIEASEAEIEAFKTSYRSGLDRLTALGALSRIEIGDDAVTHFIGDPLYKVGEEGLAEYARAAMIYHTQVLGNEAIPVILRDSTTETKIGTFRIDNVFVVHTDLASPQRSAIR